MHASRFLRILRPGTELPDARHLASPEQVIAARITALVRGDFGYIYDTTHRESPFRGYFADRDDYVRFGRQAITGTIELRTCLLIDERPRGETGVEILFAVETRVGEQDQWLYECGYFLQQGEGWRYHSGQKLTPEDYAGGVEELTFDHFDRVDNPLIF